MKQSLLEKFFTAYKGPTTASEQRMVDQEIFQNPSKKELLRDIEPDARAFLAPSGNLYVASSREGSNGIIHADLLDILGLGRGVVPPAYTKTEGEFSMLLAYADQLGVCLVRRGSTNEFMLAESYVDEDAQEAAEGILSLFDRAKLKNPSIEFMLEAKPLV